MADHLHLYQRPGAVPAATRPSAGDPMGCVRAKMTLLRTAFLLLVCLTAASAAQSQTVDLSGSYQCTEAKVRGKVIGCTAAPLILKTDGHFELRGWEGSYLVNGQWVELSDTLTKARAKIVPGHKIVLRYYGKHGWAEM